MKKAILTIGIIGAILLLVGVLFKLLHWPGAGVVVTLGVLSLSIYAVLYMLEQVKIYKTELVKAYAVLFGITGLMMLLGFLFKIMHWPGAGILLYLFLVFYVGLVVITIFRFTSEKQKELRYKYINNFIILLGGGIILLFPLLMMVFG